LRAWGAVINRDSRVGEGAAGPDAAARNRTQEWSVRYDEQNLGTVGSPPCVGVETAEKNGLAKYSIFCKNGEDWLRGCDVVEHIENKMKVQVKNTIAFAAEHLIM
jgi:hypothetical protein